jgi:hypothetical protein
MSFKRPVSALLIAATLAVPMTLATPARAGNGAAAAFGFAAGAMIGAAAAQPRYYAPAPAHVSYYPVRSHRVCEARPRVNRWGEVIGSRRVCWREAW